MKLSEATSAGATAFGVAGAYISGFHALVGLVFGIVFAAGLWWVYGRIEEAAMLRERKAIVKWLCRWQDNHVECRKYNVDQCIDGLLEEVKGGAHERFYED